MVGRFQVQSAVGRGGWGVVYRARDVRLNRAVALKILNGPLARQDDAWGWALKEARIASSLSHSCICTIYDVGEEQGMAYIAMEYIQGRPLSSLVLPSGLPPALAIHYGRLISSALSHAHERGIIHRDVKTGNVMVTADGQPKMLDFGLAKQLWVDSSQGTPLPPSSLKAGHLVGTVHYLAPELLHGERANVWSDIWSLGVVLYEMATGQLPFRGGTIFELANAIMMCDPARPPKDIPAQLAPVIERCLQKKKHRRYQRARDVLRALDVRGLPDLWTCWRRFNRTLSPAVTARGAGDRSMQVGAGRAA
jgi:serine/threonine protein kinase